MIIAESRQNRSHISDFLIYGSTELLLRLKGFIVMPLITQWLGAVAYGVWTQVTVTIALLTTVAGLGMLYAAARFLPGLHPDEFRKQYWSALAITGISGLLLSLPLWLFAGPLAELVLEGSGNSIYLRIAAVAVALSLLKLHFRAYFRILGRSSNYSFLVGIEAVSGIAFYILAVLSDTGLIGIAVSYVLSEVLVCSVSAIWVMTDLGWEQPSFGFAKRYLSFGLPSVPAALIMWVLNFSDRYFLAAFSSLNEIGYYSSAYTLAVTAITLIAGPVFVMLPNLVFAPWNAGKQEEALARLGNIFQVLSLMIAPIVAILVFQPQLPMSLAAGPEFQRAALYMPWIGAGYAILYLGDIFLTTMQLHSRSYIMSYSYGVAAVTNIIGNVILIPIHGAYGAAISTFISLSLLSTIHVVAATLLFPEHRLSLIPPMKAFLLALVLGYVSTYFDSGTLGIVFSILCYGLLVRPLGIVSSTHMCAIKSWISGITNFASRR